MAQRASGLGDGTSLAQANSGNAVLGGRFARIGRGGGEAPPVGRAVLGLMAQTAMGLAREFRRRRELRELLGQEDRIFHDIALTRDDVRAEMMKPIRQAGHPGGSLPPRQQAIGRGI